MGHRDELLSAARTLLASKGYARITARDLVAESNTNLASIGYHFGSKDGLLVEALSGVLEQWTQELISLVIAESTEPYEQIVSAWSTLLDGMAHKRPMLVACAEVAAQAQRHPELRHGLARHFRQVREQVAAAISAQLGVEVDEPRTLALASFIIATCDGLANQWIIDPDATPDSSTMRAGLELFRSAILSFVS